MQATIEAVRRHGVTVLVVLVMISAGALILLQTRRLNAAMLTERTLRRKLSLPYEGFVVPEIRAQTVTGGRLPIASNQGPKCCQVLFVFNVTCEYCRATIPLWQELADSLGHLSPPVQAIAVSTSAEDSTKSYAGAHGIRYPIVRFPDERTLVLYRATAVPQTLVINSAGVILYAKVGLPDKNAVDSVHQAVRRGTRGSEITSGGRLP